MAVVTSSVIDVGIMEKSSGVDLTIRVADLAIDDAPKRHERWVTGYTCDPEYRDENARSAWILKGLKS